MTFGQAFCILSSAVAFMALACPAATGLKEWRNGEKKTGHRFSNKSFLKRSKEKM